ncbi:hypothetical protein EON65_26860 [archaeon]|nr:MAG: hypothetical protein EON65_26860 [archaeon]
MINKIISNSHDKPQQRDIKISEILMLAANSVLDVSCAMINTGIGNFGSYPTLNSPKSSRLTIVRLGD